MLWKQKTLKKLSIKFEKQIFILQSEDLIYAVYINKRTEDSAFECAQD